MSPNTNIPSDRKQVIFEVLKAVNSSGTDKLKVTKNIFLKHISDKTNSNKQND